MKVFPSPHLYFPFSGLAFKLSLAPFHIWTPDVYEGSPLPSTIYLATIGKAVIFIVLLRVVVRQTLYHFNL
ncbi:MAG: hypothetical protein Ct9H90mP25_3210 [Gammaproteobacteria bacterium]|nr:MAG: hypothetical protein Ct9H90mP25_3210 [Gammaproteobacteria bacterium]